MLAAAFLLVSQAVSVPAADALSDGTKFELACSNPVGSTMYLPGGIVPPELAMVRDDDGFTGLVIVELTVRPGNAQITDVRWIRAEQRVSARETGSISPTVSSERGTLRAFLYWADGSSDTVLVSNLRTEQPILAYTSAYTDSGLERVSHFAARCDWLPPNS